MKRSFYVDILIGIFIFLLVNVLTTKFLKETYGLTTKEQIEYSFKRIKDPKYNGIILGNSRMYRGINPDKLEFGNFYNFAHDNDSFNQMYYKLLYVENKSNKKIKYLIMGVDYFQFSFLSDTRNYIYGKKFPNEYMEDFENSQNFTNKLNFYFKEQSNKFKTSLSILMEILKNKKVVKYYKLEKNGWYHEQINKKGQLFDTAKREWEILEVQKKYFFNILEYCKKNNIKVFMVMAPLRKEEEKCYPKEIVEKYKEFFISNIGIDYLDYSHYLDSNIEYFEDVTHLNEKGANKFSEELNNKISSLL